MASNPKMEYQVFLCIFQKNSAMATLGLKERKCKKKSGIMKSGLDAMPLFLLDDLLKANLATTLDNTLYRISAREKKS